MSVLYSLIMDEPIEIHYEVKSTLRPDFLRFYLITPISGFYSVYHITCPWLSLAVTVFQLFLVFDDLNSFEGHWPSIY